MLPKQEAHLQSVKDRFTNLVDSKYRKGQQEHGGDLIDKNIEDIIDFSIEEAIDMVVYLFTIKEQLEKAKLKNHISNLATIRETKV